MRRLFGTMVAVALIIAGGGSASACCLWPFGGWWGAGYGAPMGGYYAAGYAPAPVTAGYYSAGYYSAGYGSADCCAPACCAPSCCDSCGGVGCSSGSCGGATTPAGSLKPESDPNFDKGDKPVGTYDDRTDPDGFRPRTRPRETSPPASSDPAGTPRPRQPAAEETIPEDDFGTLPRRRPGTDTPATSEPARGTDPEPFGLDPDQINNKPPMEDSSELPAVDPAPEDGKSDAGSGVNPGSSTFLDEEFFSPDNQTNRVQSEVSLTKQTSGIEEVIAPKRLASRLLPSSAGRGKTSFAGKTGDEKASSKAPVRWISADTNVRL